ncbi:F-box-like protein [Ceratobasidium sp. AG-Ba]|nr:F-box-like protein [Ceratobasidium sp. AG-Ba]QRV98796.1 F-box-like protein [Ceratobasidium sp. AG-Ba]
MGNYLCGMAETNKSQPATSLVTERLTTQPPANPTISPNGTPINNIPTEVLSRIFELVVFDEYCRQRQDLSTGRPTYPNNLGEVCSGWHLIVSNTPILWSYIDLIASGARSSASFTRASRFLKLCPATPLFVRIRGHNGSSPEDTDRVVQWLTPVITRIYSLELSLCVPITDVILNLWFNRGLPGSIKELTLNRCRPRPSYITPSSSPVSDNHPLDLSSRRLTEFFGPLTALTLCGTFFPWNSRTFCGLTYLNLSEGRITEGGLVTILVNSPQLHTFLFGLELGADPYSIEISQRSAPLPNIQVLGISSNYYDEDFPRRVLRLFMPGARPLRFSLNAYDDQMQLLAEGNVFETFLQMSHITYLHLKQAARTNGRRNCLQVVNLLAKAPFLRELCLAGFSFLESGPQLEGNKLHQGLKELSLLACSIRQDTLEALVKVFSPQILKISCCQVLSNRDNRPVKNERLVDILSQITPVVEISGGKDQFYRLGSWQLS